MRRNVKEELRQSMDALRFSDKDKEEMTNMLLKHAQKPSRSRGGRKMLVIALAAALALVTLTGAGVYTKWSRTAQGQYAVSEDAKQQAEKSGLSVMLEEQADKQTSNEALSVTDQGITVTAVQSIVDDLEGEFIFRIEGFDLPEGKSPFAWPTVTIDDGDQIAGGTSSWFYDGLVHYAEGKPVYAATGKPVESDESGSWILDYVHADGSLEFIVNVRPEHGFTELIGKEITFDFKGFGIQSDQKAGDPIYLTEGSWVLHWPLTMTTEALNLTPNAKIGDTSTTLLTAEVGQKSIKVTYQLGEYWAATADNGYFPQALRGVRMKDGSEYQCFLFSEGYLDPEKMTYKMDCTMWNTILDLSQVESLIFRKEWAPSWKEETHIYIPIA